MSISLIRFPGLVLLSLILASLPVLPGPSALGQTGVIPDVVIVAAEAFGEDLAAGVVWNPEVTFQEPALVLRDREGNVLAAEAVVPGGPAAVFVELPNALGDLWDTDFHLVLEVQDGGVAVGKPYPFFALRECSPEEEGCDWALLGGLESEAVLTTAALDRELHRLPACDLEGNLNTLLESHSWLTEEIVQMQQQLIKGSVTSSGSSCTYYWHAVKDPDRTPVNGFYTAFSQDQGIVDAEEGGFTNGAAYSHMMQARRLTPGVTAPPWSGGGGETTVTLDLRCASGTPSCAQGCQGETQATLNYTTLGRVDGDLHASSGASVFAMVWEQVLLLVNGAVARDETMSLTTEGGSVTAGPSFTAVANAPEPATYTLSVTRLLEVFAAYDPPGAPEPGLPEQGAAHAFANLENGFLLEVTGEAPACLNVPTKKVTEHWNMYEWATWIREKGGLRNPKWTLMGM